MTISRLKTNHFTNPIGRNLGERPVNFKPYTCYFWKVKVWADSGGGAESGWAFFETHKLDHVWEAAWIRADLPKDTHPYLRYGFNLPSDVVWAGAYVCGLGLYEFEINGRRVGSEDLMPGCHFLKAAVPTTFLLNTKVTTLPDAYKREKTAWPRFWGRAGIKAALFLAAGFLTSTVIPWNSSPNPVSV
jgi:hypothetical protein